VDDDVIATLGAFLQATSIVSTRHALRWGVEYYADHVASARTILEPDTTWAERGAYPDGSRYSQVGAFLSDDITLSPVTDLNLGARFSRVGLDSPLGEMFGDYRDHFSNLTGNLGISHRFRPWLNVVGSIARGFRAPNFNDTVVLKATNDGVDAPSPGLSPELSTNYELGTKMEWDDSDLELFAFYTRFTDLIVDGIPGTYRGLSWWDEDGDGVEDPGEPPIFIKRNAAEAYIKGVEMQGHWSISPEWRVRGNAFYTYGQNVTDHEPMRRIPPLMGLAGVEWHRDGTRLEFFVRAAGEQRRLSGGDVNDTRIDPGGTPGWTDWNVRGSRSLGPVRVDLTLGNLFDRAYKEHGSGVYNPGRHLVLALTWTGVR
jgi:outer membrane receptor protein involved in Fe transport